MLDFNSNFFHGMKIEMVDLKGQYAHIQQEIDQAVLSAIQEAQFINGLHVSAFTDELSFYLDGAHVIPCANGTDASQIALMALDLEVMACLIVSAVILKDSGSTSTMTGFNCRSPITSAVAT